MKNFIAWVIALVGIIILAIVFIWALVSWSFKYKEALDECIDNGYSETYCEIMLN